jgi:hypothetical protein
MKARIGVDAQSGPVPTVIGTAGNIVMVLDGAGWHQSTEFGRPDNLRLLFLPPYSLN